MADTEINEEIPQEAPQDAAFATGENFADLLDESFGDSARLQGNVVTGKVLSVDGDMVLVDVGLKSEGRISLKEFGDHGEKVEVNPGDSIDVFVERYENRDGIVVLSRDKARREESWNVLEKSFESDARVDGVIFGRVKGGFTVDLNGAVAFLPGSQVDIRPVRDVTHLMGNPQTFQILKMDRARGNIVVSRRAVLEETRAEERSELISNLKEGQVLEGVVKNITDYGAFVDLGGVDGLLHVTDIAWRRINHPSEALQVGQTVNVQVIRFNQETQRISLGMKQLDSDPWDGVGTTYPLNTKFTGRVTNITDYGAFVELEPGVEGLVHVSEMSWTKKNVHPGKIVSTSQEVEVMVLAVDPTKRRISLGLKQCFANPWTDYVEKNKVGAEVEGEIKNITEFGLFVGLTEELDGMVHLSDLDWVTPGEEAIAKFNKGDIVKVKILDIDVEKERVSLGIKQLGEDPVKGGLDKLKKGMVVTCTIVAVSDKGIDVRVGDDIPGYIRRSDLSRDRSEQRPDRFAPGDLVDARITNIDANTRKLSLSIKAHEVEEEKAAMKEYGSSNSGASLGDILGAALREKSDADLDDELDDDDSDEAEETVEAVEEAAKEAAAEPEAEAPEAEAEEADADAKPAKKKAAASKAKKKTSAAAKAKSPAKAKAPAKKKAAAAKADTDGDA